MPIEFLQETNQTEKKLPLEENKVMFSPLEAFVAQRSHVLPQSNEEPQEIPKNLFEAVLSTIDHEKITRGYAGI